MLYEILIRRKNLVFVPSYEIRIHSQDSLTKVFSIVKNIEVKYGVTFDGDSINILSCMSSEGLKSFYALLIKALDSLYPISIYNPFYVNFPQQVIDMSEVEMYTNSVIHYTGDLIGKRIVPIPEIDSRTPLLETLDEYKVLSVTTNDDIADEIFNEIIISKSSISKQDKMDISYLIKYSGDYFNLPEKFHHKEIMAFTIGELIKNGYFTTDYSVFFKTSTDLLRLAVALSNGDVSLTEKTKFKSFSRKIRRFILSNLNEMEDQLSVYNDLHRHRPQWIRLAEKLHTGEYKKKYPVAFEYIDNLRNTKVYNENSFIENNINNLKVLDLLTKRPGIFARRILEILDKNGINECLEILDTFNSIVHKVPTPLLMNLYTLIKTQDNMEYRSFMTKDGNMFVKENDKIYDPYIMAKLMVIIELTLLNRFDGLEPLGNVYLDVKLRNYALPLSQRSTSSSVETITRYSRVPIDKDNLRFFLYWKNIEDIRVDLDLSVSFFDENWNLISYVSYTHLKDERLEVYHSGDVTSAPDGAAEHIDCNLNHLEERGVKYIVPTIHNFTNQPLENVPHASFGWMERENLNEGEIYEPLTTKNRINLVSGKTFSLPCIIDLEQREMIWADLDLNNKQYSSAFFYPRENVHRNYGINPQGNNVENNMNAIKSIGIGMTEVKKPTIYDLLLFHLISRGKKVDFPEEADIVFSVENKTHLKLTELMNDYLV